jgi:AcrR family transcriptional regulator
MPPRRHTVNPRPYRSAVREASAARTRLDVLDAARRVLAARGYAAMTMQEVAREAGVALDTVYATAGPKPVLVRLLVETAISGGADPVPAEEREYVRRIRAEPRARRKLELYAGALATIQPRLAPVVAALQTAAPAHPELAALWTEISERRARNMRRLADDLLATGEVRPGLTAGELADVLWTTTAPELYLLLARDRGWTPERFGAWLPDAWARLLLT